VVGKALKEESTQPRKTPHVTHEERTWAAWHIFYNASENRPGPPKAVRQDKALALIRGLSSGFSCCCAGFRHTRSER
jgi:hypothetical protein